MHPFTKENDLDLSRYDAEAVQTFGTASSLRLVRRCPMRHDSEMTYAGISFEADMTAEQAAELARLMEEARPTRPEGVVTALLEHEGGHGRLVAVWRDRETLDRYLAEADVPRGTELMRKLGLEPDVRRFDVLDLG